METMTKEELLKQMEEMLQHQTYMKEAIDAIEKIPYDLEEAQVRLRTEAIMQIVKEKEASNQALIALWKQMLAVDEKPELQ